MAGIYIHIPFCKKACTYCDFHFVTSLRDAAQMTEAICTELIRKKNRITEPLKSIYLGGGTPSVLPMQYLQQIFDVVTNHYSIDDDAEITMEANPDDLDAQKISNLRNLPINRFSIGVQSFFQEDLLWMNRAHSASEAEGCIKRSQDAGFENLSIDLIYGYPMLSDSKLAQNIAKILELEVPHVSAYNMTVEPKTALAKTIEKGTNIPINDEQGASQFLEVMDRLQSGGFEHYEISNYARNRKYAVHNSNYWKGVPYLGIGPSAHGFTNGVRYANIANNALYMKSINEGSLPETTEVLSEYDRFNEYMMTSLRTMWGTNLRQVRENFGENFVRATTKTAQQFLDRNWITMNDESFSLSREGKLFADHIASAFFLSQEEEN